MPFYIIQILFLTYRKLVFTLQPVTLVYSVISNSLENQVYQGSRTHSIICEKCIVITSFVCEWLLDFIHAYTGGNSYRTKDNTKFIGTNAQYSILNIKRLQVFCENNLYIWGKSLPSLFCTQGFTITKSNHVKNLFLDSPR